MLSRQLSALVDLIPMDLQEEFLECCEKLYLKDPVAYEYLLKILESITDQELLPKEFLFLLLTCLHQFYGEGLQELPETAWRGSLWVSIGLVQIQMWLPQTRFDPAVKREYKLKYSKEEVSMKPSWLLPLLCIKSMQRSLVWGSLGKYLVMIFKLYS